MQTISQELDEEDLIELKVLLCKIFEPDLCPLPFGQQKMFEFISTRLRGDSYEQIIHALDWLHASFCVYYSNFCYSFIIQAYIL